MESRMGRKHNPCLYGTFRTSRPLYANDPSSEVFMDIFHRTRQFFTDRPVIQVHVMNPAIFRHRK